MTLERRNSQRAKTTQSFLFSCKISTPTGEHPGKVLSITPRGLSITTESTLPSHSQIRLNFPNYPREIKATIEKIWELQETTDTNLYGFHFTKLSAVDYELINQRYLSLLENTGQYYSNRRQIERRNVAINNSKENKRNITRRFTVPTYPLYIGGRAIDTGEYEYCPTMDKMISAPEETRSIIDALKKGDIPSNTNEFIYARYCIGSSENNSSAILSAHDAFNEYSRFSTARKKRIFDTIHKLLLQHKSHLLDLFVAEGHPKKLGEWEFSGMTRAFEAETVSFYKNEIAKSPGHSKSEVIILARKPDGVVCISPPRNAACSNSLTGALALLGGNTLVCKPPATLPISTVYLWHNVIDEALRRNGAPAGTVNIVVGNTLKFLNAWMKDPLVNDIIYFGESSRGLDIGAKIFANGKKPILELSGKDILTVWSDADLNGAARSLLDCFLGSTQICMVPKMALIHEDIFDKFKDIFLQKIKTLTVGLPSNAETCLSPVFKIPLFYSFLNEATEKGAKLHYGGKRLNHKGEQNENGIYVEPTIIEISSEDEPFSFRCVREETFFPLLPLIRVRSSKKYKREDDIFKKMVAMINQNEYGLRASVWCKSDMVIRKFIHQTNHCGLLRINANHVDFSEYLATHGGPGKTGGPYGELNYFWQKTTHLQGISINRTNN